MIWDRAPLYSKCFDCVVIAVDYHFVWGFAKTGRHSLNKWWNACCRFPKSKQAVFSVAIISSWSWAACSTSEAPVRKSSTFKSLLIARRRLLLVQLSAKALRGLIEWYEDANPEVTLVILYVLASVSFGFFHKTLWKSLSSSSSWTCRYVLAMSADSATWWNQKRIRIPNRSFWSCGPNIRRSFKYTPLADLAEASNTTLSLVVLLASLMT